MTQITGGEVSFGKTVQPKEYESKRADVKLLFAVGEGEDFKEVFDRAAAEAEAKCYQLLGLTVPPKSQIVGEAAAGAGRRGPGRPPRLPESTGQNSGGPAAGQTTGATTQAKDPAAIADDGIPAALKRTNGKANGEREATDKPADPAAVADEWAAESSPITDQQLLEAITKKNAEIANPSAIRKLIGAYGAPSAAAMAADKRAAFLAELATLTKG